MVKNRLILVQIINTFGNAVTWTGLPVYAFFLTKSYLFTSVLFIASSIANIIMNLAGGYLVDKYSRKKLLLISLILSFLISILIYLVIVFKVYFLLFPLTILSQLFGSLILMSQNIWFNSIVPKDILAQEISRRGSWIMTARTVGFSIGPILFTKLEMNAIIIDALTFLIAVLLIFNVEYINSNKVKKNTSYLSLVSTFREIWGINILRTYMFIYLLRGLTEIITINISIYILNAEYHAESFQISLFWLSGGIGGILVNMILSRVDFEKTSKYKLMYISLLLSVGGILVMIFSNLWWVYTIGFLLTTFGNPILNNLLRADLYINSPSDMKGKTDGVMNAIQQLGNFSILIISGSLFFQKGVYILLWTIVILSALRIILFFRNWKKDVNAEEKFLA
ncbi:MFS transporter [Bacillus pseudomycoides]|uniref:MFS transporter n=1 Tax=Bacillus pseudomycoides TaxID=64104 RepID=UPI0015CF6DC4|nr:MFS transporter [Bacillus pseudomycoides]